MFSWLILRWTSGDVKDSTLLTRTCGFLVLICSASVSGGEQVRDTNLNPSLVRSASTWASKATSGRIKMAGPLSSMNTDVLLLIKDYSTAHPLQKRLRQVAEVSSLHQWGCSTPRACHPKWDCYYRAWKYQEFVINLLCYIPGVDGEKQEMVFLLGSVHLTLPQPRLPWWGLQFSETWLTQICTVEWPPSSKCSMWKFVWYLYHIVWLLGKSNPVTTVSNGCAEV